MEVVNLMKEETIQGPNGPIPLRIFIPEGEGPFPVMVFFHHGGWTFGSLNECEPLCRKMTNEANIVVVAVGYRLAPEHKYPAPLQDALAATQWTIKNAHAIKGDSHRVGVGGESAGGNLAAALSLMARDNRLTPPAFQALFYPLLTCDLDSNAYKNCPDKHFITFENIQWFCEQYLERDEERQDPYASPIKAKDLTNLPRALIFTAEWDPLCTEGLDYTKALKAHGNSVMHQCFPKVIHGFLDFSMYSEKVTKAVGKIKQFIYD